VGTVRNVSSDAPEPFVSTTLTAGPDAPAQARRFLSKTTGPRPQITDELDVSALLITELVSNAVRHGSPDPGAVIEVRVTVSPTLLRVLVRDRGSGFDPNDMKTGDTQWGIHLVRELASRWGVERSVQGTDVWFEMFS
jgi:anti-sigma regulatory factor (Ser/Thr protein kinase)